MNFKRILLSEEGFAQKFLIKTAIVVIIVVFLIVEIGPLIWFRFTTMQDAEDLASALATDYRLNKDNQAVLETATFKLNMMDYDDDEIRQCVIEILPINSDEKTSVRVTVVKYANTLVTKHIKQLKKYSRVAATKEAAIPTRTSGKEDAR
ncbi:MAG: hypothetical protein JW738_03765 [Actinobacteria bacterium]|nr:hypothetical protein [Actinomycetota bacterium]